MPRATPTSLYAALKEGYLRYFNTAFWLRDPQLMKERDALLGEEGLIFQEPLLETLLPYPEGQTIADACADAGVDPAAAAQLAQMLFPGAPERRLRTHQAQSLRVSLVRAGASHARPQWRSGDRAVGVRTGCLGAGVGDRQR